MKKKQKTHLEICKSLSDFEKLSGVTTCTINQIQVWPLLRTTIWCHSLRTELKKQPKIQLPFWKLIHYLKALYRNILTSPKVNLEKTNILCFNNANSFVEIRGKNEPYDRLLDPISTLLQPNQILVPHYLSIAPSQISNESYTYKMPYFRAMLKYKILKILRWQQHKVDSETSNFLRLLAENFNIPISHLLDSLAAFEYWHKFFNNYLKNCPNSTIVFMFDWSSPMMIALCQSASEKGIKTINIQHGKQGKNNGLYTWWKNVPVCGYSCTPNIFWCWDADSKNNILLSSSINWSSKVVVVGDPWKLVANGLFERKRINNQNKKNVMFSLQPPQGLHAEPIPDWVIEFLESNASDSYYFYFRIHPSYQNLIRYTKSRLKGIKFSKYELDDAKFPIESELGKIDFHITAFSTTCLISAEFGIPTAIFGADARGYYNNELIDGKFHFCDGSLESLNEFLKLKSYRGKPTRSKNQSSRALSEMRRKFQRMIKNA